MFKASRILTVLLNSNRQFYESQISVEHLMKSSVLSINEEIKHALEKQYPIVALESTIITHGLPYPDNVKCAMSVEDKIREKGGVPATIAIIEGRVKVGLTPEEIERLGDTSKSNPIKTSRRDIPYVIGNKLNGGTTVSGTLIVANKMGISVFATGGIGGVHREGEKTFDISADLIELGRSQVAVVSSGVKSILDIPKTLEYLETQGVFVATYGETTEFPAFYSRSSGCHAPYSVSGPVEAAKIISSSIMLKLKSGMLFAVPVPEQNALDNREIQEAIEKALEEAKECKIRGKQITPFLLRKIWEITQGKSLHTNIALIENNATVAAQIAVELEKLRKTNTPTNSSNSGSDKRNDGIVVIGGSNLDICAKIEDEEIKVGHFLTIHFIK
ncbi:hypothetical protein WA026_008125 [Henosepilachna vigintioctopunctata]|uniref:Pseudouridine-5'-phosphate glycosidase n=1 Tax=Henosepilachna vigintioctopunctata TaxID=420089 RepID=A0AAW1TIK7_9CUCU